MLKLNTAFCYANGICFSRKFSVQKKLNKKYTTCKVSLAPARIEGPRNIQGSFRLLLVLFQSSDTETAQGA